MTGYIDFYFNAYPILAKYNFKAVSFIPIGLVGTSYYMNWDQIKQIQRSGLVTFEGHTISHPNLTLLAPSEALQELKEGKEMLLRPQKELVIVDSLLNLKPHKM